MIFVAVIAMLAAIMSPSAQITLGNGIGAGIIVLSLVLLVGYAGEVSFATMAFAGIGGTVFYHWLPHHRADVRAGLSQYLIAVDRRAPSSVRSSRCRHLRLRGLYLGLATAAFSVGVEKMVFGEINVSRRIYPMALIVIVSVGVASIYSAYRTWRLRGGLIALGVSAAVFLLAATNSWLRGRAVEPVVPAGQPHDPAPEGLRQRLQAAAPLPDAAHRGAGAARPHASSPCGSSCLRPSPRRHEGQPGGVRDARAEHRARSSCRCSCCRPPSPASAAACFGGQIGSISAERFGLFESFAMFMLLVVAGVGYVSGGFVAACLTAWCSW